MALDAPPALGEHIWTVDPLLSEGFVKARVVEVRSLTEIVVAPEGHDRVLTVPLRSCWPVNEFAADSEGDADCKEAECAPASSALIALPRITPRRNIR